MSDQVGEPITEQGLRELHEELAQLEGPARQEMAKRIQAARELGDLSENAEYHIAKEDQAHLETKIARLQERLRNATVVKVAKSADVVAFGIPVTVTDEAGKSFTWTIVGPTEADVASGKLSSEAPIATALMGAAPGQTVDVQTPRGTRRMTVDAIG